MHITSGMLHFYTKHPWVIDIFFIFHSFFIPRGSMEKSETWQILLNLRTPTRWLVHKHSVLPQTLSNSEDKDNGIPIFYCCHIPLCFVLPNQLNMSSVKTGACELRWAWGSIWNWGLKIVERKCAYFFLSQFSRESSASQSVFSIMVYINKLILGTSVCVCFCNWFCVSVCACVYHGPCFLWRKETVKPTWKFIRAVSGAQSIHLKTLLLCWVECPEIFRAVLTTILSFHVVSDTIFGSCESFAPCGWLRICIYLIPALISRPFGKL